MWLFMCVYVCVCVYVLEVARRCAAVGVRRGAVGVVTIRVFLEIAHAQTHTRPHNQKITRARFIVCAVEVSSARLNPNPPGANFFSCALL